MILSPAMEDYIRHWGEMGSRWGVNRSIAQVQALLYLSERPLHAETISDTLGMARSNVSTSLKELQDWRLVRLTHLRGDRRDHFEAECDPWQMLFAIADGRKRREVDPTLDMLRTCAQAAEHDRATSDYARTRMRAMYEFLDDFSRWYEELRRMPSPTITKIFRLGGRIAKLVGS